MYDRTKVKTLANPRCERECYEINPLGEPKVYLSLNLK